VLFVVVMRGLWARRSDRLALWVFICGVTIGVVGLLLHIWSDDPLSITWWLLAGAVLASQNAPEKSC
jgi:predicted membrane channel-forming protein YqfA (hemolysin III family)